MSDRHTTVIERCANGWIVRCECSSVSYGEMHVFNDIDDLAVGLIKILAPEEWKHRQEVARAVNHLSSLEMAEMRPACSIAGPDPVTAFLEKTPPNQP